MERMREVQRNWLFQFVKLAISVNSNLGRWHEFPQQFTSTHVERPRIAYEMCTCILLATTHIVKYIYTTKT
ncbi:hypothetical protein COLO4_09666 [Corchorus olitorius]|uniref:Uncharacterized protein n=1 Tax=Corchorus olitorius TaxID=93759 RepID=A0A1R3KBK5_9ROSI|nr:hypothetical protein COLO4_09666 [Corchorus olitorius]